MPRITYSLVGVIALTLLVVAFTDNPASADRSAETVNSSPDGVWFETLDAHSREVRQNSPRTFRLDKTMLISILERAPMEFTDAARHADVLLTLPMPDGRFGRFRIVESPIMEKALAAKFSEIRTYRGQGLDDPTATARFDITRRGFHAQVLSGNGSVYLDPNNKGEADQYISYYKSDAVAESRMTCLVETSVETASGEPSGESGSDAEMVIPANGSTLRTYRLALAVTGEYTIAAGGTVPLAMAAMTTSMNRINGIYERELAVRMTLVANNNLLIYTNPATDPYTNGDGTAMMGQNQANLDTVIGNANYDIGHAFSTGPGGIAAVNSVCNVTFKGQGVTGLTSPFGDPFDVDYASHEMGHQFGAIHTFNTLSGGCSSFRNPMSAYEPGSGSTIMGYAGTCAPDNLQLNSNDNFHVRSIERMLSYMNAGGACAALTATGNTPPAADAGPSFTIPRNTPFALTAVGSDPNSDALTYSWEQYDLGPASPPEGDLDGMARPLFRVYAPITNPARTFPSLQYILNNANVPPATYSCGGSNCLTGESSSNMTRTMTFQVTVRDNRSGGGGIVSASTQVSVNASAGPFNVTAPNTGLVWNANSQQTVTWNVASTNIAPVSAANVRILLSTDGGLTFPTTLVASTPNDGTESITVPNINSVTARIKVGAVGNIFFDISNVNFTVTGGAGGLNKIADFDGDGRTDVSVYRPSAGSWYLSRSTLGFAGIAFGLNGDLPVPGDYDGDGRTDVAVYRNGAWYILQSSNGAFVSYAFGSTGDIPVAGRYDVDSITDIAVFRPSNGTWYFRRSADGTLGGQQFGQAGDVPMSGDFDGDGRTDFAVFRGGTWYIQQTTLGFTSLQFGAPSDRPAPADYDGDGRADIAVFRSGSWYLQRSSLGFAAISWGVAGDRPSPGDYDGDGISDVAVFRPADGNWYILRSSNGGLQSELFGTSGDISVPGAYIP